MNRELITAQAEVLQADSEELFAMANAHGLSMPHPALGIFRTILSDIEKPNENDVRLGEKATKTAINTLIGCQLNFNHLKRDNICGFIIDAKITKQKQIEIVAIFFKDIYEEEWEYAKKLQKKRKLSVSWEISADIESQDKLADGTRRVNDYYFTGVGFLLGVPPACSKAYVQEMAQKIQETKRELVCAKKSTMSIIDAIIKVVNESQQLEANYQNEEKTMNIEKLFAQVNTLDETKQFDLALNIYYAFKEEKISEEAKKWSTKFINNLPNSSFAVIEPAYLSGKTKDKRARHLPFKDANGKVDLPHYKNALARMNQIKPVTDSISAEELRKKAKATLDKYKKVLKTKQAQDENKQRGNDTMELKELKTQLTAELGEEIVADWTDEDFQNEEKVAEARQAKEAKKSEDNSESEEASEEKDEGKRVVTTEKNQKTTSTQNDDGKEEVIEETLVVQKVDGKEIYRRKTNEERMYAENEVEAVKAELQTKIDELTASLEAKNSEIEEVRANAEKIGKLKVQYKDNEFTAEFKDEDWLNEDKIQEAVVNQEKKTLIAKNKEELKENEFAQDFSDEDYANETKVELAKVKAENKALKDKQETEEAEEKQEEDKETVNAKKDEDMDTGNDTTIQNEFTHVKNPVSRMILISRKEKKEKLEAKKK
jgi:hypothetical protein